MRTRPIIRATGLTKRFGRFTAVDALSFAVAPGSIFAFLGANGSGKSTTIRMLIGLLTPTAGAIEVDGIDVIRTPRRVRDLIGYMGQRVSLYQALTLRENLEFYGGLYDLDGDALERRWGALRERFALGDAEHERVSDLPTGVRQRAGLALSTLHRPRVLFLDEPTAGVDLKNRLLFWELIQEEAAAGVTVFVTTHFLEEVEYCDWVCLIDEGRLIANAEPDDIRQRYSSGYRIRLGVPDERRAAVRAALAAADCRAQPADDGITVDAPGLTPAVLDAIAQAAGNGSDGRVHVEQPAMTAVFRALMMRTAQRPSESDAEAARGRAPVVGADEGDAVARERDPSADHRDAVARARDPSERAAGLRAPATPRRPARTAGEPGPSAAEGRRARGGRYAARWRRLRTLMRREVRATLRDVFTVTILIAVPIGSLLAFGYTLSVKVRHVALGVHDASDTSASRRLIADLAANGTFDPQRFATRAEIDRALVSGRISAAIVIPPDFDRALDRTDDGRPAEIQVLYDGGETVVAGNAEAFFQAITRATGAELAGRDDGANPARDRGVTIVERALFNPTLNGVPFMVAGTFGFVLTFLTTLITAVSIVNERLTGTFDQLQITPATSGEIVLGKILPLGAVFAIDVVLMVAIGGGLLGAWPAGSILFFIAVASFYVLISLALGLIFSATSGTAAEAVQKTVLFSVPLNFLSGFVFPIRNMPWVFRALAKLLPPTHFLAISRAIYLRGAGPLALLPELALLALFAAILMAIALRTVAARA